MSRVFSIVVYLCFVVAQEKISLCCPCFSVLSSPMCASVPQTQGNGLSPITLCVLPRQSSCSRISQQVPICQALGWHCRSFIIVAIIAVLWHCVYMVPRRYMRNRLSVTGDF